MEYEIIGMTVQQGEYEGNKYHNLIFYCSRTSTDEKVLGKIVKEVKIPYMKASHLLKSVEGVLEKFIGEKLVVMYNEKGYVEESLLNIVTAKKN